MGNFYQLNEITLITVAGVNIESAANALLISSEFFKFGSIKLLSPTKPLLLQYN